MKEKIKKINFGERIKEIENFEEFYEECRIVALAMQSHGGSFVAALGLAVMKADHTNKKKIKKAFSKYWKSYKQIAERRIGFEKVHTSKIKGKGVSNTGEEEEIVCETCNKKFDTVMELREHSCVGYEEEEEEEVDFFEESAKQILETKEKREKIKADLDGVTKVLRHQLEVVSEPFRRQLDGLAEYEQQVKEDVIQRWDFSEKTVQRGKFKITKVNRQKLEIVNRFKVVDELVKHVVLNQGIKSFDESFLKKMMQDLGWFKDCCVLHDGFFLMIKEVD